MSQEIWITNITNMNISLSDLNITVKPYHSINLLDKKHYNYTIDQIVASKKSGSLYKKRNKIIIRRVPPLKTRDGRILAVNALLPSDFNNLNTEEAMPNTRTKSVINVEDSKIDSLFLDDDQKSADEKYAEENADFADMDDKPIKFK